MFSSGVALSPAPKRFEASVTIEGMDCSSCAGKISRALEPQPWLQSVDVSLLTQSASLKFEGKEHVKDIVNIIGSVGYKATVQRVDEVESTDQSSSITASDVWQASYAVGEMTCSSCVGTITNSLTKLPWIRSVDVSLITNSATVEFDGQNHFQEIPTIIENAGYTAKLDSTVDLNRKSTEGTRRMVEIRVGGMYCGHCAPRVTTHFADSNTSPSKNFRH